MKDFVSNRMLSGVALVAVLAAGWSVVVSYGVGWPALVSVGLLAGLSVAAAYWRGSLARPSIADVLHAVDGEPALALAPVSRVRAS
jgi:hypothetical protein